MRERDEAVAPPISLAARRQRRSVAPRTPARPLAVAPERLLHRAATVLHSDGSLEDVLGELAVVALEASGGDRCGVFLLDRHSLVPLVARIVAGSAEPGAFRRLGAIDLAPFANCRALLADGRAVGVADARAIDLIPPRWVEALDLRSVTLVPVLLGREPRGLIAITYAGSHELTGEEQDLLEALAAHAAVAVRTAGLADGQQRDARMHAVLARCLSGLPADADAPGVARLVASACAEVAGTPAAVVLFDETGRRATLLAASGAAAVIAPGVPDGVRAALDAADRPAWVDPDDGGWLHALAGPAARYLVVPVRAGGRPRAALVSAGGTRTVEQYDVTRALGALLASALEQSTATRRADALRGQLEIVRGIAAALATRVTPRAVCDRLSALLAPQGLDVVAITLRDRHLARQLGWDASSTPVDAGTTAVPMRLGRRVAGHLHVAGHLPDAEVFLDALGACVADVLHRMATQGEADEATRARALVQERALLASELHDVVGELFTAIALHAHHAVDELPAGSPWAERLSRLVDMAKDGKWAVEHADRALSHAPVVRRSLHSSLQGLARAAEAESGITVVVTVTGRPATLPVPVELGFYRVAYEALAHAWRHAGCSLIAVALDYADDATVLRIRDDGIALEHRVDDAAVRVGAAGMRRAMADVRGSLRMANAEPRGVVVEARVAKGAGR